MKGQAFFEQLGPGLGDLVQEKGKGAAWEPPQSGTSAKRSAKGGANASIGEAPALRHLSDSSLSGRNLRYSLMTCRHDGALAGQAG